MSPQPDPLMRHLTDEELLLDYYEESSPSDRARAQAHLERCDECRSLDRELREVLSAVETTPLTEPPGGFEREMWARIEPLLPVHRPRWWTGLIPRPRRLKPALYVGRLAFAAAITSLVVVAFTVGRVWDNPPVGPSPEVALDSATTERLLRSEVEDHLERSQRVLVELVNANVDLGDSIGGDKARAADLVAAGRLYRRSVEDIGDSDVSALLEDLERVLAEMANQPADAEPEEWDRLRQRIDDQDLMFRLRVVTTEMRERERRARQNW